MTGSDTDPESIPTIVPASGATMPAEPAYESAPAPRMAIPPSPIADGEPGATEPVPDYFGAVVRDMCREVLNEPGGSVSRISGQLVGIAAMLETRAKKDNANWSWMKRKVIELGDALDAHKTATAERFAVQDSRIENQASRIDDLERRVQEQQEEIATLTRRAQTKPGP